MTPIPQPKSHKPKHASMRMLGPRETRGRDRSCVLRGTPQVGVWGAPSLK